MQQKVWKIRVELENFCIRYLIDNFSFAFAAKIKWLQATATMHEMLSEVNLTGAFFTF